MDYDFYKDEYGEPVITCSMEYEAIGVYLTEELAVSRDVLKIIADIALIESQKLHDQQYQGKEFQLKLTRDDAIIRSNILDALPDDEIPEELEYYDSQSESMCGLDDFKYLLEDWLDYLKSVGK